MLGIRDLMREVSGKLAAGVPKLRQTPSDHADRAAVRGTHRPADLWVSAMRRLADGSRG